MNKILVLLFLLFSFNCFSQNISGKVIAIIDGDTFKLLTQDSLQHRIRIANIDCPEKKQPFSNRAKQFTSEAIFGKMIMIEVLKTDRYGRLIGVVTYDKAMNLNHELVKNSMAWHYVKYSNNEHLQKIEDNDAIIRLHGRYINTNFSILVCADGFNLMPNNIISNEEIISETIFNYFTYKRLNRVIEAQENHVKYIKTLDSKGFKM
jgi:hypothetical protein